MTLQSSALVLAWVAIVVLAFSVSGLLRQIHALRAVLMPSENNYEQPPRYAPALNGLGGSSGWHGPTILFFLESTCGMCREVMAEIIETDRTELGTLGVAAIFDDAGFEGLDSEVRIIRNQSKAFHEYQIPLTPFAVAVHKDGTIITREPVGSRVAVRHFVGKVRERMGTYDARS